MKLNKVIIPLAVAAAVVLTTGTTQAKDGPRGKTSSLIEIVLFGNDRKSPPKKKYVAPPRKIVVKKPAPKRPERHDKKRSKRRN
ncbi:MAG: hypothetical protein P1V20_25305 [Verrucomicrobiales bacterium]|nr:hypothetical protein [Verrucomicrobiales bacterium]